MRGRRWPGRALPAGSASRSAGRWVSERPQRCGVSCTLAPSPSTPPLRGLQPCLPRLMYSFMKAPAQPTSLHIARACACMPRQRASKHAWLAPAPLALYRFDVNLQSKGAYVLLFPDGSVAAFAGGTELGQGLTTKVKQVWRGRAAQPAHSTGCWTSAPGPQARTRARRGLEPHCTRRRHSGCIAPRAARISCCLLPNDMCATPLAQTVVSELSKLLPEGSEPVPVELVSAPQGRCAAPGDCCRPGLAVLVAALAAALAAAGAPARIFACAARWPAASPCLLPPPPPCRCASWTRRPLCCRAHP